MKHETTKQMDLPDWTTNDGCRDSRSCDRLYDDVRSYDGFYYVFIIYDLKRCHSISHLEPLHIVQHVKDSNNSIKGFRAARTQASFLLFHINIASHVIV